MLYFNRIKGIIEECQFTKHLHHHCITCSPMDPLQWKGATEWVQTADKNIIISKVIRTIFCEAKSCVFVINKSIVKIFFSNHYFWLKYESSIYNIPFSVKRTSRLNQERNMQRSSTVHKWKPFWTNMLVDFDVRGRLTGGSRIMDYGLVHWPEVTVYS